MVAAWLSIPAAAHAQTSGAERSLMNRVGVELRGPVVTHQSGSTAWTNGEPDGSQALLGTVGAMPFAGSETAATGSGFPTLEQALLGQRARPKARDEN
jgi:hypothetical protein